MSSPTPDEQLLERVRRTYAAVAEATRLGAPGVRAVPMTAEDQSEPASAKRRTRRQALLAVAAVLVSASVLVGVLVVRDGTFGSSTPNVRTPAGPGPGMTNVALSISDDQVLDLVAPVSYLSRRNAAELDLAIARRQYEQTGACIEDEIGFEVPAFQVDNTRFFALPDPDELRSEGFNHSSEGLVEQPFSAPDGFDEAALACYQEFKQAAGHVTQRDALSTAWAPIELGALARPDERIQWQLAAECFRGRGYAADDLDSESSFVAISDRIGQDSSLSDAQREARDVELANDYVDCTENVWTERAAHLLEQRDEWATAHAGELDALATQLRAAFGAEE